VAGWPCAPAAAVPQAAEREADPADHQHDRGEDGDEREPRHKDEDEDRQSDRDHDISQERLTSHSGSLR
jgi:hypothetical protein